MEEQVKNPRSRLSHRLLAAVVVTSSLATFFTSAVQFFLEYRDESSSLDGVMDSFEKTALVSIAKFAWNVDQKALNEVTKSALAVREFAAITAIGMDGAVLAKAEKLGMENHNLVSKTFDLVSVEGEVFGHLQVRYTRDFILHKIQLHAINILATNFFKSILVSMFLLAYFQRTLVAPIVELSKYFDVLIRSKAKSREPLKLNRSYKGRDEFYDVVHGINNYESKMKEFSDLQEALIESQEDLVKARTADLQSKGDQLTAAIEVVPGFVVWFDTAFKILGANKRWASILGPEHDGAVNADLFFLGDANDSELRTIVKRLDDSADDTVQYETVVERQGGSLHFRVSVSRLHATAGFMVVAIDTTEAVENGNLMETERSEMQLKLAHSARLASLGTIGAGVAHELNNPLGAIRGFSELIRMHPENKEKTLEYGNKIYSATIRMHKIVSELRSFSREGTVKNFSTININSTIRDSFVTYEAQYVEKQIAVDFSLTDDMPAVLGDSSELESVIQNLFANSRDAYDGIKDGRQRKVVVQTQINAQGLIQLIFTDNAGGMPEHVMKRIFDPFFTTKDIGKGTGLGMAIVRGIIERHKATIAVSSKIGDGTTFQLEFPASEFKAPPRISVVPTAAPVPELATVGIPKRKHIMVVDDEPLLTELVELYLEDLYSVTSFFDPAKALEAFSTGGYDAIITDVKMPGMLGTELLARILKIVPNLPAVIMSGDSGNSARVLELVNDTHCKFIQKPFKSPEFLLSMLKSVIDSGVEKPVVSQLKQKHIVVIDDESMLTELISAILEGEYAVTTFNEPAVAVADFNRLNHDLVLVDMNMPGLSGKEVLTKIRSVAPDLPTIVMSGHSINEPSVQEVIAEFKCGFISKPFDSGEILNAVAAALAKGKGAAIAA